MSEKGPDDDNVKVMKFSAAERDLLRRGLDKNSEPPLESTKLVPALQRAMVEAELGHSTNDGLTGMINAPKFDKVANRRFGVKALVLSIIAVAGIGAGIGVAAKGCSEVPQVTSSQE